MKFVELEDKEFDSFAIKHECSSFMEHSSFAHLKAKNGWNYKIFGLKDDKKIVAATILMSKNLPFGKKMFYAPRGYLLDYNNEKLFKEFNDEIVNYCKKNKGMFLKIDPYIVYKQRDKDGNIVDGGLDNSKIVEMIKKEGFIHQDEDKGNKPLQIQHMYWIRLKDRTLDDVMKDMTSKTRQMIRKNERRGVVIREGSIDDFDEFDKIMMNTGSRKNFASRDKEYNKEMYEEYGSGKLQKIMLADIEIEKTLNRFKEEYSLLKKEIESYESGEKTIKEAKLNQKKDELVHLEKDIKEFEELYKKYGEIKTIGAITYFVYGNEVLSFLGGSYDDFIEYQPFYTLHYEMIKYAIENKYNYYNFYGISKNLTESDPMYGVYLFKKGFGGEVVELIGEYDYKLSFTYYLYKIAYRVMRFIRKSR